MRGPYGREGPPYSRSSCKEVFGCSLQHWLEGGGFTFPLPLVSRPRRELAGFSSFQTVPELMQNLCFLEVSLGGLLPALDLTF